MRTVGVLLVLAAAAGCADGEERQAAPAPTWDDIALTPAKDLDPAPNAVAIELEARPAKKRYPATRAATEVWAYDGRVPGPLIEAKVGDALTVRLTNQLPKATTVHWHGVRVPNAMDGVPHLQGPIEPGQSFDYAFTPEDAGLFWFHPHLRSDVQVERGLYGALVVRGESEPKSDHEAILILDDIRVNADGTLPEHLDDEQLMLGRHGNLLLVNGQSRPELALRRGSLERWRLVNAANGRFFNLRLPGHTLQIIGTDGGLVPKPRGVERLLIAPGERYDVMFIAGGEPGESVTLWNDPYERGHGTGSDEPMVLATVRFDTEAPLAGRQLPGAFPDIEQLPTAESDFQLELGEAFQGGDLVFTINGKTWPDVPPLMIAKGELKTLSVSNVSDMDHPFHLHGFFFQVPGQPLAWKDTVIVGAHSKLSLVARYDRPGHWMYHCHLLEHAEHGMMGEIHVE